MVNPFDPAMRAYISWEHVRMQQKIYEQEQQIEMVQKNLKLKMHREKRLQEIMQLCDLKEDKVSLCPIFA